MLQATLKERNTRITAAQQSPRATIAVCAYAMANEAWNHSNSWHTILFTVKLKSFNKFWILATTFKCIHIYLYPHEYMLDSHVVIHLHVCVYALARQFVTKTPSRPQSFAWRAITSCKCMHALLLLVKIHCHLLNTVVLQCLMLPSFIILLLRKLQVARLLTDVDYFCDIPLLLSPAVLLLLFFLLCTL